MYVNQLNNILFVALNCIKINSQSICNSKFYINTIIIIVDLDIIQIKL